MGSADPYSETLLNFVVAPCPVRFMQFRQRDLEVWHPLPKIVGSSSRRCSLSEAYIPLFTCGGWSS